MKNAKRATRNQAALMEKVGFLAIDYGVTKDSSKYMHISNFDNPRDTHIIDKRTEELVDKEER